VLNYANIELDSNSCELKSEQGSLRLNNTEAELLTFFIHNAGTYFSPAQINSQLWNGKESPEKAELYIYYLKNKLRQIHSLVSIQDNGDTYALGKE
jgi:DNA-binding response OmpR family regulator